MDRLKILVTGANGYIGRHVVSRLVELGHAVSACDLNFTDRIPGVTYLTCNILQEHPEDLYTRLGAPDVCLHRKTGPPNSPVKPSQTPAEDSVLQF